MISPSDFVMKTLILVLVCISVKYVALYDVQVLLQRHSVPVRAVSMPSTHNSTALHDTASLQIALRVHSGKNCLASSLPFPVWV